MAATTHAEAMKAVEAIFERYVDAFQAFRAFRSHGILLWVFCASQLTQACK
jgi:hypothetical protein